MQRSQGPVPEAFCSPRHVGLGLRASFIDELLRRRPALPFFEVISENYMGKRGRHGHAAERLEVVLAHYPVLLHGVSLSIGSTDALDGAYLDELRALADRTDAALVSDHLCWTGAAGRNSHDLLPLPLNEASLQHVITRVRRVMDRLKRPIALENPTTYVEIAASQMPETEFLARLTEATGCLLLLDLNNVHVNAHNHGFSAERYIDEFPAEHVAQLHIAGHSCAGRTWIDTHGGPACADTLALYERFVARAGVRPTVIEWDANVPALPGLLAEVGRVQNLTATRAPKAAA